MCLPLPWMEVGVGSFASSTVCLPPHWAEVGEGLICIIHSFPSILGRGGGGAHLHHPQCDSSFTLGRSGGGAHLYRPQCDSPLSPSILGRGGGGAHLHHPQCDSPLSWAEVGEGLICIIHSVIPLYLGQRWGRGSFASSTV